MILHSDIVQRYRMVQYSMQYHMQHRIQCDIAFAQKNIGPVNNPDVGLLYIEPGRLQAWFLHQTSDARNSRVSTNLTNNV